MEKPTVYRCILGYPLEQAALSALNLAMHQVISDWRPVAEPGITGFVRLLATDPNQGVTQAQVDALTGWFKQGLFYAPMSSLRFDQVECRSRHRFCVSSNDDDTQFVLQFARARLQEVLRELDIPCSFKAVYTPSITLIGKHVARIGRVLPLADPMLWQPKSVAMYVRTCPRNELERAQWLTPMPLANALIKNINAA